MESHEVLKKGDILNSIGGIIFEINERMKVQIAYLGVCIWKAYTHMVLCAGTASERVCLRLNSGSQRSGQSGGETGWEGDRRCALCHFVPCEFYIPLEILYKKLTAFKRIIEVE